MTPDIIDRARANDPSCIPELLELLTQATLYIMQLESKNEDDILIQKENIARWRNERRESNRDYLQV